MVDLDGSDDLSMIHSVCTIILCTVNKCYKKTQINCNYIFNWMLFKVDSYSKKQRFAKLFLFVCIYLFFLDVCFRCQENLTRVRIKMKILVINILLAHAVLPQKQRRIRPSMLAQSMNCENGTPTKGEQKKIFDNIGCK